MMIISLICGWIAGGAVLVLVPTQAKYLAPAVAFLVAFVVYALVED